MIKQLLLFAAVFLLAIAPAFGASGPRFRKGAAELGIGGATSLYGYNASAVIYNPALLNRAKFRLDLINAGFVFDNQFVKMVNFVEDNQEKFANFDSLSADPIENRRLQGEFLKDIEQFDDQWLGIGVSPLIGVMWKHFGLAITGQLAPEMKLDRGIFNPAVGLRGVSDAAVYVGYGSQHDFSIAGKNRTIEYGATLKYLNRR